MTGIRRSNDDDRGSAAVEMVIIAKVNHWGAKVPDSTSNPGPQGG